MDAKIKKRWVKALRSGKYKRGVGQLCIRANTPPGPNNDMARDSGIAATRHRKPFDRFCCLGVLCDIQDQSFRRNQEFLSQKFAQKVGLSEDTLHRLAGMNDGGYSFRRIASYIERNL